MRTVVYSKCAKTDIMLCGMFSCFDVIMENPSLLGLDSSTLRSELDYITQEREIKQVPLFEAIYST